MPKFYEPKDFENCYSNFLEEKLSGREPGGPSYYIDPDCEEDIGKTEFYNDLTDFLNEREERFVEERFIEEKINTCTCRRQSQLEQRNGWKAMRGGEG